MAMRLQSWQFTMAPQCLLEIHFEVKRERHREFTQSLESFRAVRAPGQLSVSVYGDNSATDQYFWVEEWPDDHFLESYVVSDGFRAVLGYLRTLGPLISCRIVGPDVPEKLRNSNRRIH